MTISQAFRIMVSDDPAASFAPAEDQPFVSQQDPAFSFRFDRLPRHIPARVCSVQIQREDRRWIDAHRCSMIRERNLSANLAEMKSGAQDPDSFQIRDPVQVDQGIAELMCRGRK